jgi:co-chaperonin GroES (HSP10)
MARQLIPIKDYIILEMITIKASGIILPQMDKPTDVTEFKVFAIGKNVKEVAVGDIVVCNPDGVLVFSEGTKKYYLTREDAVGLVKREVKN